VNGQKVWTTLAHISDWYFVLVRTSTEGPKWAGLTLLLMDLKSPGVQIKPIRQIDGGAEFNEVFMTDVRVPVANRLGAEGQGWEIVSSALVNERSGIAGGIRADHSLEWIISTAKERGKTGDPAVRQKIADLATKVQSGTADSTPKTLDTPGKRALFNNLGQDEALALRIDAEVRRVRPDGFRGNQAKENIIKFALLPLLGGDATEVQRVFSIIKAQPEY
jgi:hypothetical protein